MGLHGSKQQKIPPHPQSQQPTTSNAKPGDVKKGNLTEKIQKNKISSEVKSKNDLDIPKASKQDILDDKTPLHKPDLPYTKSIDQPIQSVKGMSKISKSEHQLKSELRRHGLDPPLENQQGKMSNKGQHQVEETQRKPMFAAATKLLQNKLNFGNKRLQLVSLDKRLESNTSPSLISTPVPKRSENQKLGEGKKQNQFDKLSKNSQNLKNNDTKQGEEYSLWNESVVGKEALRNLRQAVHNDENLQKLHNFGIPDQHQLCTMHLATDSMDCDFGGHINYYYSLILRNYIPTNTLERYRGFPNTSPCLDEVDVTRLESKVAFRMQDKIKRFAIRDKQLNDLHGASVDEIHFEFLKDLATNQSVSIPLTLMHDIADEVLPMVNHMQAFYNKHLGTDHQCTAQATHSFIIMLNRVIMYNSM